MKAKELILLITLFALTVGLFGCEKGDINGKDGETNTSNSMSAAVNSDTAAVTTAPDTAAVTTAPDTAESTASATSYASGSFEGKNPMADLVGGTGNLPFSSDHVDIDFALINDEDYYDEFSYVMYKEPQDFHGMTMRLIGKFTYYPDENGEIEFYYVVIRDEAGCCESHVELGWKGGAVPDVDSLPENGAVVNLIGKYDFYHDDSIDWDVYFVSVDKLEELSV
ncbi:MAG: hypothetical protein FWF82_02675 [Oscillospiraceae bacterium]|nr:hypothetical protein [Oscillospiraceae bacterium]